MIVETNNAYKDTRIWKMSIVQTNGFSTKVLDLTHVSMRCIQLGMMINSLHVVFVDMMYHYFVR